MKFFPAWAYGEDRVFAYNFIFVLSKAAFVTHQRQLYDTAVKFEIWDTAGQERYRSLAPMYYRGAKAAIVAYSTTDKTSFGRAKDWIKELGRLVGPYTVIALVGNVDADPSGERVVSYEVII